VCDLSLGQRTFGPVGDQVAQCRLGVQGVEGEREIGFDGDLAGVVVEEQQAAAVGPDEAARLKRAFALVARHDQLQDRVTRPLAP